MQEKRYLGGDYGGKNIKIGGLSGRVIYIIGMNRTGTVRRRLYLGMIGKKGCCSL